MDISDTIQPTSDQLDAVDLLAGERTFTIAEVTKGNAEQPVQIKLAEFPRPWRPGKSMRRVLVACWGKDASQYVGRRVTLYCDPDVRFGGQAVGGTRIRALSHLDKPKPVPLLVSRGKSATVIIQPLPDAPPPPDYTAQIANSDKDQLRTLYTELQQAGQLSDVLKQQITARVAEIDAADAPADTLPVEGEQS